jgi:hypothetical protein
MGQVATMITAAIVIGCAMSSLFDACFASTGNNGMADRGRSTSNISCLPQSIRLAGANTRTYSMHAEPATPLRVTFLRFLIRALLRSALASESKQMEKSRRLMPTAGSCEMFFD